MERRNQNEETSIIPTMDIPMMDLELLKELTTYVAEVKRTLMTEDVDYVVQNNKQYTTRSGFAKMLAGAGFKWRPTEKRFVLMKPEGT